MGFIGRGRMPVRACLGSALLIALLATAPASAAVTSVSPADQDGPDDSFYTNEILYAVGVNNALGGGAQLCVVDVGVSEGTCEEDGRWGRPNAVATQGTFPPQPIVAPPLPEGTFRILADNGDGPEEPADVVSDTFTVIPCPPGDDCSTKLAQAQMQEWKDTAAAARTGMDAACLASSVFDDGGTAMAGSALLGSGRRGAIMAEIKGNGVGLAFGPRESQAAAFSLLRTVSCGAFLMYDDIVADPPDPDFKHLEEPEPDRLHYAIAGDNDVAFAVQTLEEVRAQGVAHRIGIERYQGAELAGDAGWAAVHADRVGDQALATQAAMRRLGRKLRTAATSPAVADPDVAAATTQQLDAARTIRARVRMTGFTAEERAELEAEGLSDDEIAEVREQLGAPLPVGGGGQTPAEAIAFAADRVDDATCIDETDLCGFDVLGRAASAVGGNGRIPPAVTVSSLTIREGDVGFNHGRVLIELSHPSTDNVQGSLALTRQTLADGEVAVPRESWQLPAGDTRTYRSVTVANDNADEPDETATIVATPQIGDASPPTTLTVLDDDGAGDPPTPPRARRGLIAILAGNEGGAAGWLSAPDGTELTPLFDDQFLGSFHHLVAWSPDGRWLLAQMISPTASGASDPIYRLRVTGDGRIAGGPVSIVEGNPLPAYPTFSQDGRRLLMSQHHGMIYKLAVMPFDPATGETGAIHVTGDDPALDGWWSGHGASFSPDRSRIAFAGCAPAFAECGIWAVPVDDAGAATGPPVAVVEAPANSLYFPAWSPDGRFLAYRELADDRIGVRTLRVDADGRPLADPRWISGDTPYWSPGYPAWSPDSKSLAFATPTDPMLADNAGGAAFVVDLDAAGGALGQARQLGLAGWAPQVLWGMLPDDAPPVTTATLSPEAGADGVHRSAVTVSLRATDNRAVAQLEYALDGVIRTVGGDTASFELDRSGTYEVRFRARDAAGNVEAEQKRTVRVEIPSPLPSPPPPPPPVAPPPPPPAATPAPAAIAAATLPSNGRCVSRRRFRIRLRQSKEDPLVRASVYLGKKRVRVASGKRLTAVIDLRGLPKGKFTVRVVGITRSGRQAVSKRSYRTCAPKRRR